MKFVAITDIHLGPEEPFKGIYRKLNRHSERLVSEFVERVNNDIKPDFVVSLGDCINNDSQNHILEGDLKSFNFVNNIFSKLKCPLYHVFGNHDTKIISENKFREITGQSFNQRFDFDDFTFLTLFGREEIQDIGVFPSFVDENQIDWLKNQLESAKKDVVIFSHYPLDDQDLVGNFWWENLWRDLNEGAFIKNRKEVRKIFEKSKRVKVVINGHLHWNNMVVHNKIPYFTIQSLIENFNNDGTPSNSYAVVELNSDFIDIKVLGNDKADFHYDFKDF